MLVAVLSPLGGAPLSPAGFGACRPSSRVGIRGLRDLISPRGERVTGLLGGKEGDASQDDLRG